MVDHMRPASIEDAPHGKSHVARVGEAARFGGAGRGQGTPPKRGLPLGLIITLSVLMLLGSVAFILAEVLIDSSKQYKLRTEGISAPATILGVTETNTQVNHRWVYELQLEVRPKGQPPYRTRVSQAFSELHAVNLRPGGPAEIKYDRDDPKAVTVISTGGLPAAEATAAREASAPPPATPSLTACREAAACCLLIVGEGEEGKAGCQGFLNPIMPPASCSAALNGYRLAAKHKGLSCPDEATGDYSTSQK